MTAAVQLLALLLLADTPKLLAPGLWERPLRLPDGGTARLFRYVPAVPKQGPPVLLVPELGLSRRVFDAGGFGLAPTLQRNGHEAFILEARPDVPLAALLTVEVPAALEELRRLSPGVEAVDLVAHGYAGALAIGAAAGRADVRRIVALAVPDGVWMPSPRMGEALVGTPSREELDWLYDSQDRTPAARRRSVFSPLSRPRRGELHEWMRSGQLPGLEPARIDQPVLLVLPLLNRMVHPEQAATLRDRAPRSTVLLLSKLYLASDDHSHLSMLLADGAERDVFVPVLRFLEAP